MIHSNANTHSWSGRQYGQRRHVCKKTNIMRRKGRKRYTYVKLRKRRDLDISAASYRMFASKQICCFIDTQRSKVAHQRPTKVRVSCCHRTLVVVLFLWVCGGYVQRS